MKIYTELGRRAARGEALALATVVKTEGSAPAESSMKMLVGESGRITGTIGGGHVEATVEAKAREAIATGAPALLDFTLDDDLADEGGLICGGTVHILVERIAAPAAWAARAADLVQRGRRGALLARIGATVERELLEGAAADTWLASEEARLEGDLFIEPLLRPRCIILGAGHVGRAVARVAHVSDFGVAIVEDREDQAQRAEADEVICADLVEGFAQLDPSPFDYVVVMTRGTGLDLGCARAGLLSPARYVGLLASRRKAQKIREALDKEGIDGQWLHAPIGLDLGATSAGEIAVSVVAQLIKVRRLGRGDR